MESKDGVKAVNRIRNLFFKPSFRRSQKQNVRKGATAFFLMTKALPLSLAAEGLMSNGQFIMPKANYGRTRLRTGVAVRRTGRVSNAATLTTNYFLDGANSACSNQRAETH